MASRAATVVVLEQPVRLTALRCEAHPRRRPKVFVIPRGDEAPLRCWCSVDCAKGAGWPFLPRENHARAQ